MNRLKLSKKCTRCKKKYMQKDGRGSARAKYCYACRPIVKAEHHKKAEAKYAEKRNNEKGYVVPKSDDLIFYGYKAPLTKFKEGFGYMGVLQYNKAGDKIQCHFCGRMFKNVGSHSAGTHKISAREYKEKVGLEMQSALVGEGTRKLLINAHKDIKSFSLRGRSKREIRAHMKKMSDKSSKVGQGGWKLERRNYHGQCPEQLIHKIKQLNEKLGRRPKAKDYVKEYGSYQSIITVYGKWNTAIKLAGLTTFTDEKHLRQSREFLLESLKLFYKKHGRTPRSSDSRRGLIPHHQTYWKVFGSMNNARKEAGIPQLIQISKYRYEEFMPKRHPQVAQS